MRIWADGDKDYGEWHLNKRHGSAKVEFASGRIYWGNLKDKYKEE
jgi:hypothetical protein